MDRRFAFFPVVVVVLLVAAGCQQSPYVSSHLEILSAERRALEDRVLDLEFELERAQKKLETQDGMSDSNSRGRSGAGDAPASDTTPEVQGGGDVTTPSIEIPGFGDDVPTLEPPRVNEGQPTDGVLPSPDGDSAMRSPRYQKPQPIAVTSQNPPAPPRTPGSPRRRRNPSRAPGDPRITHIELNTTLTGGTDFDRKSGDDGLIVVLEPRNADNEFVPLAGPVTVVLLDYTKRNQGAAAMIARWKIKAPEVHKSIVDDEYAQGIQLRLPWSDQPPTSSKLRLDVRYTTVDGRNLDARTDVFVTLPGQFSSRWTPRAPKPGEASPEAIREPVNLARQPGLNESAAHRALPTVTQSAFTTIAREARPDPDDKWVAPVANGPVARVADASATGAESERVRIPSSPTTGMGDSSKRTGAAERPTWQPNR